MSATPLITVIMATYNRSNVLPYSIGSVLDQTLSDFELLVVGDGCTDDSAAVVESLGDGRVRWIGLPQNSGHQSVPNNHGLAEARGRYIAYIGHDDLWLPQHLAQCVEVLEAGADLAYGLTLVASEVNDSHYISPYIMPYESGATIAPSSMVHRKVVTDEAGNWPHYTTTKRVPEAALWQRLERAGYRMVLLPRLAVVKVPAANRKDVYKIRSTQEQAAWQERIRNEADFEAREVARSYVNLRSHAPGQLGKIPYRHILRQFVRETLYRLQHRLRQPRLRRRPIIEQYRQHKGLTARPRE